MPVSLDHFTDEDLLTLCRLADVIKARRMRVSIPEREFLRIMSDKQLWTPKDG